MDNLREYLQNALALAGTGLASLGSAGIIPSEYAEAAAIGGGLAIIAIAEKLWRDNKEALVNELEDFVEDKTGLDIEGNEIEIQNNYKINELHAVDFIIETCHSHDEPIYLCPTGPLTNIALALKKDPTIANKIKEIALANIDKISDDVISLFEFQKVIKQAKDIFIQKYNNMMQGVEMKHYLFDDNGDLVVTNPEGYVAIDVTGNAIKFVDRLEFSRANFAIDKSSKFKKN